MDHTIVFSYYYERQKNQRQQKIHGATWMRHCNAGRIAQWSTSQDSLEATGCRHRVSAHIALRWRPPWATILVKQA